MKAWLISLVMLAGCGATSDPAISSQQEKEFEKEVTQILSIIDHPCHLIADGPYLVHFQAVRDSLSALEKKTKGSSLEQALKRGVDTWEQSDEYNATYECMGSDDSKLRIRNDSDLQSINNSLTKLEGIASSTVKRKAN